ncbi:MAG: sigma-70 family RNA polymerase sigma factor [Prevotellaceae bacterium]|nr:sigma-70 family RNA polymerase sigma factor [Prevotellaceae bacterium]
MQDHRKSAGAPQLDPQTLGQLYETHAPQLLNLCLRYVKNRAEAEDVLHDAFVVIFTHIDAVRDETKLVHWMTAIVRNLALRQAKAAKERLRLHEAITEEPADDSPTPSSAIPMERLLEAIETLPRGYGEVFRLAVLDGLSHEEIGQLLGIAPHSSSSQLARAKRMLRKLLADYRLLLILPAVVGIWIYRQHSMRRQAAPSTAALPRPLPQKAMPPVGRKGALPIESARRREKAEYTTAHSEPTPPKCSMTSAMQAQSSAPLIADRLRFAALSAPLPDLSQSGDTVALPAVVAPIDNRQLAMDVHVPSPVARKHYPWTVNFGGGAATASSNSPIKFDYLSLTDHANGGVRRKIHSLQELSDYLVSNRSLLDSLEQAQLNRFLLNNVHSSEDLQNLNETERHQRPVTMSLSVGKQLSERWFFGTGVSYTRLDSEFESAFHKGRIQKQQRIDYLGVPLRFTYRVWGKGCLDVYATGGATFEWPVRTSLKKAYVEATDSVTPLRAHFSAPCQWSVQLGAGVEYRLVRPFTLFVEPSVTHYFGTGTPVRTYRTEHPWSVAVPFGIRLTW